MSSRGRLDFAAESVHIRQLKEVEKALRMMGLDPTLSAEHGRVWDSFVQFVRDVQNGEYREIQENLLQKLKHDPLESMKEVFRLEFQTLVHQKENGIALTIDHLKERFPDVPNTPPCCYDKFTGTYTLNRRLSVLGICKNDVDPLTRFTFVRGPSTPQLEVQEHDSVAVRAIVAHYACMKAKCQQCKKGSCIMYNGIDVTTQSPRKWTMLVCSNCGSAYTIKSVKKKDMISTLEDKGSMSGSSFCQYYAVKDNSPRGASQFIAILCLESTKRKGVSVWPVYVAKVDNILPRIKNESFDEQKFNKIYSIVLLRKYSMNHWFDAPCFAYDPSAIAADILSAQS
jgi:hypothetical protein